MCSPAPLTPLAWDWDAPQADAQPALAGDGRPPVTLWLARIATDSDRQRQLHALLSADERARLARFSRTEDQHRFLTGRGLLRRLLSAHLRQPAESLVIRTGTHGKPFVELTATTAPLYFNSSHSGDFVLIALSPTHEVGVDIEREVPDHDFHGLAAYAFPKAEYEAWRDLPASAQLRAFYRAWTRHEAGLKALGCGFADAAGAPTPSTLTLFDLHLPSGYAGAVAIQSQDRAPV